MRQPTIDTPNPLWWGDFTFALNQILFWQLGPCVLCLWRKPQEWRMAYLHREQHQHEIIAAAESIPGISLDDFQFHCFGYRESPAKIKLTPILATLAQVSRPELPFYIPGYQNVNLIVSSPVWIRIELENGVILQEVPSQRLSDTWFGETTLAGELCFASTTRCRTEIDSHELYNHRLTTTIAIQNHAQANLLVSRIKLPLPSLSVYKAKDNSLWTEDLIIENGSATGGMITDIEKSAPSYDKAAIMISGPRTIAKSNRIIDMLNLIL